MYEIKHMEYILFNRIALIRYVNYLVESLKSCSQKEKKAEVINMPRIAIVDDQEEYLEEICNLIEKFYFKNGIPYVVNTFSNAQLLLYEMEEKLYFDIYLLDIEMPGINGLSLAEKIRSMDDAGYIVFITSHLKFLINGYDYFAYQFIPKNNLKKKLISTLESLQKRLDIEEEKFYQICINHRYEKILYKDIYYVYKDEKYAIFVTQNGNIPIRETLKNIYKDLEQKEFIFIDRGYIVNVVHIMSLYKNTIYLRNSKNLKISRTYTEEVKKRIHTYWKEHTTNGRDIHT